MLWVYSIQGAGNAKQADEQENSKQRQLAGRLFGALTARARGVPF